MPCFYVMLQKPLPLSDQYSRSSAEMFIIMSGQVNDTVAVVHTFLSGLL